MMFGIPNPFSSDDEEPEEPDDAEEYDPKTHSINGEEYQITPTDRVERAGGRVVKVWTEDEGVVAGPYLRRCIEGGQDDLSEWVLTGYQEDMQDGLTVSRNPYDTQTEHTWVAGNSGSGKSKEVTGIMLQRAYAGDGFVFFDPKGDDSEEIIRRLPENRKDDVVWIDPGSTEHPNSVGLNPLAVPVDEDASDEEKTSEIESRLKMVKAALEAKGELHATMKSIVESMGRAMMKSNVDPARPNYSLIDMYFILLAQERRQDFAMQCQDPFISEYLMEVAEMDDDEIRPLLKRIKGWVENGVIRRIIACRDPSIDFDDVVENNRIVFVRTGLNDSDDVKRLTTLSAWREVSSAQFRAAERADDEPGSYFMYGDEFDSIVSDQLDINNMFSRARSKNLGLTVMLQFPGQLDDDEIRPINNNTNTSLFLKTPHDADARVLAGRFNDRKEGDLTDMNKYKAWSQTISRGGETSQSLLLDTWPPMPPLRSREEAQQWIADSVEKFGDERLTTEEIARNLQFGDLSEATGEFQATDDTRLAAAKAIYDHGMRKGIDATDTPVLLDDVADDIRRYVVRETGMTDDAAEETLGNNGKLYRQLLQRASEEIVDEDAPDGGTQLRVTRDAVEDIRAIGVGESDGGAAHARLLRAVYDHITPRGGEVEILEQGDGEMPDAQIHAGPHADDAVVRLCGGRGETAPVEAEKSTGGTKPGQTVINLAGAANFDAVCIFVARETVAHKVWDTLAADPPLKRDHDPETNLTRLYNATNEVRIDGDLAYRPGSRESHWFRDEQSGEIVLRDDDGTEHGRFASAAGVERNTSQYDAIGEENAADHHRTIRAPVVPCQQFNDEPDDSEWSLLVATDDGLKSYDPNGDHLSLDAALLDTDPTDPERLDELGVTDGERDVLDVLVTLDNPTVNEVQAAEDFDCSDRTVRNRMDRMVEKDALDTIETPGQEATRYTLG